jgi:Helix-turn-helix domain
VEHRKTDIRQVAGYGASGDDAARFLRELRQLRDSAGLGPAELAARAHFPYDSIRAAEVGPALPDLPVLSAYVRGCGGTTEEWEERWRSLTSSPSLPVSAARNAGRSDAATAGARIGSVSQAGENPDPSIIMAALNRVAEGMASPGVDAAALSGDIEPMGGVPSSENAFPSTADAFPSAPETYPPAPEPLTGSKSAGWDPIRVSTAWPTLRDTPTVAPEPAASTGTYGGSGTGVPWGTPPWTEGSSGTAVPAAGAVDAAAARTAADAARVPVAAAGSGGAVGRDGGAGNSASWTRVMVISAVLLCVLAVLLAVFA